MNRNRKNERIGEIKLNNQGLKMKIIKYENCENIDVQFENGYISKNNTYVNFKRGNIKNILIPNIYNVGFIGEGKYKALIKGKITKEYICWSNMLRRCYNEKTQEKYPAYIGCTVCKEWHNFQNFAEWFNNNYYEIEKENDIYLDKDILIKGNKIYSPDTCIFVPRIINNLFTKNNIRRGEYPIGVYFKNKNFVAQCSVGNGIQKFLGNYNTPEDAFNAYKKFKENLIKQIADDYKDRIPKKLYDALYNYKVEIND